MAYGAAAYFRSLSRIRIIVTQVLFLLCCFSSGALADACGNQPPRIADSQSAGKHWSCKFEYSDEFNDGKLDGGKWNSGVKSWGEWSWDPANAEVKQGALVLRMSYAPHTRDGKSLSYKSGIVISRVAPIKYGFIEARIKAADRFPGVCSAFWLYKVSPTEHTEIDIVELLQQQKSPSIVDQNLHVFRLPDANTGHKAIIGSKDLGRNPSEEFHTYGLWWDDRVIRWYVDGRITQERANVSWHQPLDVVLSMGLRQPLQGSPSSSGFPTQMYIDYIRVWQEQK